MWQVSLNWYVNENDFTFENQTAKSQEKAENVFFSISDSHKTISRI